jgi:uncharacterized LabA/DUF88 family protein
MDQLAPEQNGVEEAATIAAAEEAPKASPRTRRSRARTQKPAGELSPAVALATGEAEAAPSAESSQPPRRRPARRPRAQEETQPPEEPAAAAAEQPATSRRGASRRRGSRVPATAEADAQVAPVAEPESEERSVAAEPWPAEQGFALVRGQEVLPAAFEATPEETRAIEAALEAARKRQQRWRPGERPPVAGEPRAPEAEPNRHQIFDRSGWRGPGIGTASTQFEPLPPPTKRKAPRVGTRGYQVRPAVQAENAVDWALGRTSAEPLDVAPSALPETTGGGRRRRRPRHDRRGATSTADVVEGEPAAVPATTPAQAPVAAPRDAGRSQLGTLEALVARQNVVLDALLARITSLSALEHTLSGIERRLAIQSHAAAGAPMARVGIFVDVPNIIYAAERIGATIDFGKLLQLLTRGRELVRAAAYAPISDDPLQQLETQKFVQPFVRRGYRIVTKPLKRFSDSLDIVCLVSGDGDFSHLVDIIGSKGVRVEVIAFGASTSAELRAICDDYLDLSTHLNEIT